MKVRASVKKRSEDCKIVRRKGRLYVINKKKWKYEHQLKKEVKIARSSKEKDEFM